MKKLVLILATLLTSALPLLPSAALASTDSGGGGTQAPSDATWVDAQTITSATNGGYLYDASATTDIQRIRKQPNYYAFKRVSDPDACPDYIEVKLNAFTVAKTVGINSYVYHYQKPYGGGNNNCQDIQQSMTNPANPSNAGLIFDWIDSATIRPIQHFSSGFLDLIGGDFILDPTSGNYIQSNGTCNSYIDNVSADHKTATFHLRVDADQEMIFDGHKAKDSTTMGLYQNCYQIKNSYSWITQNGSIYYLLTGQQGETKPTASNAIPISIGIPTNFKITGTPGAPGTTAATPPDACATATGAYAWLLCPVFSNVTNFLQYAYDKIIQPLLEVSPLDQNTGLRAAAGVFTGLADVFFVIVFLIMIFGTALNLNAYTIKRTLPRIIIAAIAIQFSFYLCGIVVDIGNVFGGGIQDLVSSAFTAVGQSNSSAFAKTLISGGVASLTGIIVAGALLAFFATGAIMLVLGLGLSVLIFILTLVIRKLVITVLIILAPIAIAAWVLPNTEKYFKLWMSNFIKTVMVYPIIALLLSAGYIVQKASGTGEGINQIIGGLAPIIVFGMAPLALKGSGQLMNVAGRVSSQFSGLGSASGAATKAGKAPFKAATAGFGANRKARTVARDNERFAKGGFGSRAAGLRLGAGLGTGIGLTTGFGLGRKGVADSKAEYARKLASAESAQRALANQQIKDLGTSLEGKDAGKLENGVPQAGSILEAAMAQGASAELQQAAIVAMAKQGKTAPLAALRDHMNNSGRSAAYEEGIKRSDISSVKDKAPQLLSRNGQGAFENMNAEKLAKLDSTGAQAYVDHLKQQRDIAAASPGTDEATDAQGRIDTFESALEEVRTNGRIRPGANAEGAKIFYKGTATDGGAAFDTALMSTVQASIDNSTGHYLL